MSKKDHKCKKCADARMQETHGGIYVDFQGLEPCPNFTIKPLPNYTPEPLPKEDEWKRAYMTLVDYLRREYQRDHKNRFKCSDIDVNGRANAYARAYAFAQGVASSHDAVLRDLDD